MLNRIRFKDIKEYTECSRFNEDLGEEKKKFIKMKLVFLFRKCVLQV